MKMHPDTTAGAHRITGYGAGFVTSLRAASLSPPKR
jgi:hypothetical protein